MKVGQSVYYRKCAFLVVGIKDADTVLLVPSTKGMRGTEPIEADVSKVDFKSR